nr:MAG TPA: hypothetical protein [Caudoviricetes sp.]
MSRIFCENNHSGQRRLLLKSRQTVKPYKEDIFHV